MSEEGRKKALIVSISDYDTLDNLDFCKNDGEMMFETLSNLGYEIPNNRKIVGRINGANLRESIIDFFRDESVEPNDTLLFYFSGHGVLDGYEGRYFATSDINKDIPEERGIQFNLLSQQMDRSPSLKTIALLDCCFSGAAIPGVTGKGAEIEEEAEKLGREALSKQFKDSKGKCILASSLSQRRSYNLPSANMSAFTNFVIEGLKGKKESIDVDGFVTPEKLGDYVWTQLHKIKTLQPQEPVKNYSISGRIALAYYPELVSEHTQKEIQKKNQENANFGFWTDIKNKIKSASLEIKKNPTVDVFAKSAIEEISVVGLLFLKMYENGKSPEIEKTKQIQTLFKFLNSLDEEKLEKFCRNLIISESVILEKTDFLKDLSENPESIISNSLITPTSQGSSNLSNSENDDNNQQIAPLKNSSLFDKGVSLYMNKDFEKATKIFDQIYRYDSKRIDALKFKGRSLAALNRHQPAVYYFNQVLSSDPNDVVVLFLKAHSLVQQNNVSEAIRCYDQILQLEPNNQMAKKQKSDLQRNSNKGRFRRFVRKK